MLILIMGFILFDQKFAIASHIKKISKITKKENKKTNTTHNKSSDDIYICSNEESLNMIIEKTYSKSRILSFKEYRKKFLDVNRAFINKNHCIVNSLLKIPDYKKEFVNRPLQWDKEVFAIYIRWDLASIDNIINVVEKIKNTGINGLVIDAKDIVGILTYKSTDPMVQTYQNHPPIIKDMNKLVHFLHENNIYVIIRQALFQDMNLLKHRKDLAIYNENSNSKTIEYKGIPIWVDPAKEEVQDYNLRIFKELLTFGVDEIQFDYVRYPAEGDLSKVIFYKVQTPEDKIKHIENFLFKAWFLKYGTDTKLSLDVFGIVAWQEKKDIEQTGQDIPKISKYLDYISPMLYPSHFQRGFEGLVNPADHPEYIYEKGMKLFANLIPEYVKIRPWIQAFKWRVTDYNEQYIHRQIKTTKEHYGYGWIMWNAGNQYEIVFNALRKTQ